MFSSHRRICRENSSNERTTYEHNKLNSFFSYLERTTRLALKHTSVWNIQSILSKTGILNSSLIPPTFMVLTDRRGIAIRPHTSNMSSRSEYGENISICEKMTHWEIHFKDSAITMELKRVSFTTTMVVKHTHIKYSH